MDKDAKIFEYLDTIAQILPLPIYWLDKRQRYLGLNEFVVKEAGVSLAAEKFVNKTPYDLYPKEVADTIVNWHKKVITTEKTVSAEGTVKNEKSGAMEYFKIFYMPINDNGRIIGTLATSVNISAEKEAAYLRFENEKIERMLQKIKFQGKEQLKKIIDQIVHDIRSPLASLLMTLKSCEKDIPEQTRVALKEIAISIDDVANHLLSKYKKDDALMHQEERQSLIVSLLLLQLLTEKKYQYKNSLVKFSYDFVPASGFTSIRVESAAFKRMISNLIDNAVQAFAGKDGKIILKLAVHGEKVKIIIQDNGKGMPLKIVNQIMNNVVVQNGKDEYGIGLVQVRETLKRNDGEFLIESKEGKGTKITLIFPRVESASWLVEEIKLHKGDTVVILDDDSSVHSAWKSRFKAYPGIKLEHFKMAEIAMDFINAVPIKDKILLLADFELLKQELNGLHVIEQTGIQRSILVTNHYRNQIIRELAAKIGTKILPKQLAAEIPIKIDVAVSKPGKKAIAKQRNVEMVIIDDNPLFVDSLAMFFHDKIVDKYYSPLRFLENVTQYAKDTIICIDDDLCHRINGAELARQLSMQGYTKLYILTGRDFKKNEMPAGLNVILKTDIDALRKIVK